MKPKNEPIMNIGLLTAITASLCCITPVKGKGELHPRDANVDYLNYIFRERTEFIHETLEKSK